LIAQADISLALHRGVTHAQDGNPDRSLGAYAPTSQPRYCPAPKRSAYSPAATPSTATLTAAWYTISAVMSSGTPVVAGAISAKVR
jgi:hypothetical protein